MNITRNLTAIVFVFVLSTTSFAQFVDFSSQTADGPTWTANAFGGTATASFSSSFSNSAVRWAPQTKSFSNQAFQNMFGNSGSLIALSAQDNQTTASTTASFVFDSPIPEDAMLIVMDLDGVSERIAFSSNGGPMLAPVQIESNDPNTSPRGASSFALWSQNQERLLSNGVQNNDREAYLFDVGGRRDFSLVLTAGEAATAWIGIAQPLPVPEPGTFGLVFTGLIALGMRRRRS